MQINLNGQKFNSYETSPAHIVVFESDEAKVDIELGGVVKSVRPLGLNISPCNKFTVDTGSKVIVEFEDEKPLFLFTYLKENANPEDYTYYYGSGEHYVDELHLKAGESIYVAAGAVLKMHLRADGADNIKVAGRGIIDTSEIGSKKRRQLRFIQCNNLSVSDITLVGAIDWTLVPIKCNNVNIQGVNVVSWEVNGDGIDIVGCRDVVVKNCFLHCADDCLCVKANDYDDDRGCNNVENVRFEKCILWNTRPGNAMEVGFETRCEEIKNIVFSDIDVLHCVYESWESGGVFTIHNGDRAKISNVTYENIRVENAEQKLFDFKVLQSRYSKDADRGFIENINIRDIYVYGEMPPSIMRGCDNQHGVKNVRISGLYDNGKKVENILSAHIIAESGSEVMFE